MLGEPIGKNPNAPLIVGLGGTTREGSSTELALRFALKGAETAGARTLLFNGPALMMPMYAPEVPHRTAEAREFIAALRAADGVVIASPAYHGSISGLVKNALDYTEDMRNDPAAYLDGRAVGCITCAYGPQAAGTTLESSMPCAAGRPRSASVLTAPLAVSRRKANLLTRRLPTN